MANILDNIAEIKSALHRFGNLAVENKWIEEKDFSKIKADLEKEKLTIGIIGQMKNGKSTMLNALIFGKDVLPSATTPMTAALTTMTYSEQITVEVEFFTSDEWSQIVQLAASEEDSAVVNSAKELVDQAEPIKGELNNLGKKKNIGFIEMADYIGAEGKYVPITKALKIGHPNTRLKSADIVDTPGFNDPVVSREQRSKEFLEKADVVIVVLYAGRAFDESDRTIIFDQIRSAGIGKVILVLNKYDLALDEFGSVESILTNTTDKLKEQIEELDKKDPILASIFRETKIILFSSLFALFSKMEISETTNEELIGYYEKFKDDFPQIKSKADYLKWSHLQELESEIENVLKKDRLNIIIKKPASELIGKIKERGFDIEKEAVQLKVENKALGEDGDSVKENIRKLNLAAEKINSAILETHNSIRSRIRRLTAAAKHEIISKRDNLMNYEIENLTEKSRLQLNDTYITECKRKIDGFLYKFLSAFENELYDLNTKISTEFETQMDILDTKITEIATQNIAWSSAEFLELKTTFFQNLKYNPSTIDCKINFSISGTWGFVFGASKDKVLLTARDIIKEKFSNVKITGYVDDISLPADGMLEKLKETFRNNTINPIMKACREAEINMDDKKSRIKEIDTLLDQNKIKFDLLNSKVQQMETYLFEKINN